MLEALRWLLITGSNALQVLREDQGNAGPEEDRTALFLKRLQPLLDEMHGMGTDEDYILLADLMEYELLPMVQEWQDILKKSARI